MTRKLLISDNASDSLKPGSTSTEPIQHVAPGASKQGVRDGQFGYGGGATVDGNPGQDRPRDERLYPSGEQNRQGINRNSDWDKSVSHNDLTKWTLQQLSQGGRPVEPAADVKSPGFENFAQAKEKAAEQIAQRLGLTKGSAKGDNYGATDGDLDKPQKLNRRTPVERQGY